MIKPYIALDVGVGIIAAMACDGGAPGGVGSL